MIFPFIGYHHGGHCLLYRKTCASAGMISKYLITLVFYKIGIFDEIPYIIF